MGIDPRVLTDMGIWGIVDMTNPQQREEDRTMTKDKRMTKIEHRFTWALIGLDVHMVLTQDFQAELVRARKVLALGPTLALALAGMPVVTRAL